MIYLGREEKSDPENTLRLPARIGPDNVQVFATCGIFLAGIGYSAASVFVCTINLYSSRFWDFPWQP